MNEQAPHKKIIHVDMDAFYASIEQRDNTELRNKPIAVGGSKERGVVAAASYEARKYGVKSAMPSKIASEKCADLIFVKPRFERYKEVSAQIMKIFKSYTDLVEPLSLDEAFLDVTNCSIHGNSATKIATAIRNDIFQQTGLRCSAGISYNKFLAKIASDINKPNGQKLIHPAHALAFINALPIEKFFGVGKATAEKFKKLGIENGADLRATELGYLIKHFGKSGKFFYDISRGIDHRTVKPNRLRKSVGVEKTFDMNLSNEKDVEKEITRLCEQLIKRSLSKGISGKTLTFKYRNQDFETFSKRKTLTDFYSSEQIVEVAKQLSSALTFNKEKYRLLGFNLKNLNVENTSLGEQLKLEFY